MPSTSNDPGVTKPAIVFSDVRKTFTVKHTTSLKETFVSLFRGKELSSKLDVIDGLSLEVPEGQSIALMGRNGSGKSTTLKLLSGVLKPDAGWVRTRGRVGGLLEVGAGFNPDLTGRENVYLNGAILGMSREETDARFDDILEFSELGDFIDTEVKHYSSGMNSRLGFAIAIHTEIDVMLVDEVLSVGDASFRQKCMERIDRLREQRKTMFIVSHNAAQVARLCDRGVVLKRGKVVFDGPIDDAIDYVDPLTGELGSGPVAFRVRDRIKSVYDRSRSGFGRPIENQVRVEENGGGWVQRFEHGVITYSEQLGNGAGVKGGPIMEAYLEAGGPAGPWGFVVSGTRGSLESGTLHQIFQRGRANHDFKEGVSFIVRD